MSEKSGYSYVVLPPLYWFLKPHRSPIHEAFSQDRVLRSALRPSLTPSVLPSRQRKNLCSPGPNAPFRSHLTRISSQKRPTPTSTQNMASNHDGTGLAKSTINSGPSADSSFNAFARKRPVGNADETKIVDSKPPKVLGLDLTKFVTLHVLIPMLWSTFWWTASLSWKISRKTRKPP